MFTFPVPSSFWQLGTRCDPDPDPRARPAGLTFTFLNAVSSRPLQEGYLTNPRSLWEDYPHVHLP